MNFILCKNILLKFSSIFLIISSVTNAQNLLNNGDFESGGTGVGFDVNGVGYTQIFAPFLGTTIAGNYAITTDPQPMNTSTFIAGFDHTTGTGTGKMLIIDGNTTGGNQRFWRAGNTGGGVCGLIVNATYKFSYWIKSVSTTTTNTATQPFIDLQFNNASTITLLSGSKTAPLPAAGWVKVVYTFKATNSCVNIELWNTTTNPVGNDFAVDDFSVTQILPLTIAYSAVNPSCPNTNDGFISVYGSGGTPPYTLYNLTGSAIANNSTGIFSGLLAGTYNVSVKDSANNTVFANNIIIVQPPNPLVVSPTQHTCPNIALNLTASAPGATSYFWTATPTDATLTNPNLQNQTVSPAVNTTYNVIATTTKTQQLLFNGDFTLGNIGFTNDYLYINPTNTIAAQTAYGVVTNPNTWESTFTTCGDHTTATGRMMVVDGSTGNSGNNKLWSQTIPVNAGQNYTFSYWIQTVALTIPANIETLINGVSVGFQLAPVLITCGNWTQFTYTWNSGLATSAQIVLYDRVTVSTGNDFALDDLSFTTTTICSNSKNIQVNTPFAIFTNVVVPPIVVCPNSSYVLNFFGTPDATVTFSSSTGIYYTVILDANGQGTFTTPNLTVNTTFTLKNVTRSSPACSVILSDSLLISIFKNGCTTVTGGDQATVGTNSTPPPICTVGECRNLSATYSNVASTSTYIVEPILFCPDTSAIGTQVPIVADDIWSNVIPLPFEFCFFNQNYTTCQVGTNALISFNPQTPGGFCPYNLLSVQIPNTGFVEKNAIYGVYQDVITNATTPFPNLSVNYKLAGTYPCRKLIVNFTDLSQFSCQNSVGAQTSQIILYEISNVIEIYVKRRQACLTAWNGAGVIGIQNAAGTSAFTPVGRNTGTWSANDEAYRFTPSGPIIPSVFEWLQNGNVVSTNATNFTVCPTVTTIYTAQVKYNVCGVTKTVAAPPVTVEVIPDATVAPQNVCFTTNPVDLTVNEPVVLSAVPVAGQSDYFFTYYANLPDAQGGVNVISAPTSYNIAGFGTAIYMVIENINNPCRIIKSYTFINCLSPCPTITNPSLNQTLCENNLPSNLSVSTTFTGTDAISFVSFSSPQTGNAMYSGGILLGNVTPSGGTATLSSSLIPTAPGNYYIYAVANPPPADATCRPFQLIYIKINVRADAGIDGQIIICDNNTSLIILNNLITGEQIGGVWTRATGTGGIFDAPNGTFTPAIGTTTSTFDYTITGLSPCPNDSSTATISINAYANAGNDANPITICNDSTALIDLNAEITGEQVGGTWTRTGTGGVFNATAGTFTPAGNATTSVFTYTVVGNAPCLNDTSTVTVNINPKPNAGTDGTPITICDNNTTQINLFNSITGEQSGGTWTRTGTGGTFDDIAGTFTSAAGATSSTFTYTKIGIAPCLDDTSQVVVNINPEPLAGTDGNITICDSSTTLIDLNLLITGEQTGGTWTRTTGIGGTFTPIPGTYLPSSGASTSTFTYTKTGIAPCLSDTSIATVNIITQPNAGTDGVPITVCENDTNTINLYSLITGEQIGGAWTRTGTGGNFDAVAGTFLPAIGATTSTFTYTLTGLSPCIDDTSQVIVNISPEAKAGTDGTTAVCDSSTTPIDLNLLITGEQSGGTWSRNNGSGGTFTAATGIFIPAINATTSTFTYTKTGVAPCPTDTSSVIININHQSDAGTDGMTTVCGSNIAVINLSSLISGEEPGGTWTRTSGTGGVFAPATGLYTPAAGATQSTFDYSFTGITPCIDDKSTATVKFNPLPTSSISSSSPSVCKGYAGPTITFTGIGGTAPYTFNYNLNGTPLSITTTTGDSVTTTVNTATAGAITYTIDSVQDANCLNAQNEVVIVNVLNAPIVNTPTTFIICDDNASYDGIGAFDLHSKDNSIRTLPSQVVGYYLTQTDAVVGLNDGVSNPEIITNPYINIAPGTNTPVQVIWVKVIDPFAPQCYTIVQMELKVNPRPLQNLTLTPLQICDVTAPAVQEPFDLHAKDADIINGQTGVVVNYFATQALADTNNPANALPNQNAYVIPNTPPAPQSATQTIWYNASFTSNGCGTVGPLDLIVNPLPNATQPAYPSYQLCETPTRGATGGLEIFNLDSKISEISLFPTQSNVSVTFYLTYNDALANINVITNTSAYPNSIPFRETIGIRVTNVQTGCYRVSTLDLVVNPLPLPVPPTALATTICDDDNPNGTTTFDLSTLTTNIIGGANGVTVSYHSTLEDAENNQNALPNLYDNINPFMQSIWVRETVITTGCYKIIMITLTVNPAPILPLAPELPNLTVCDEDSNNQNASTTVNLTVQTPILLALQAQPANFTVRYFDNLAAASSTIAGASIFYPQSYIAINNQSIWVRIENNITKCFKVVTFKVIVNIPLLITTPAPLQVCDDGLLTTTYPLTTNFDLTKRNPTILNGALPANFTVDYYTTQAGSLSGTGLIASPTAFTNTTNPQTLGVVVTNMEGCKSYTTLRIDVLPLPTPGLNPAALPDQCDDNIVNAPNNPVGFEYFNLTTNANYIKNGDPSVNLRYFPTQADADAEPPTNEIKLPTNDPANALVAGDVFIRVESNLYINSDGVKCYTLVKQKLKVNPLPTVSLLDAIINPGNEVQICQNITVVPAIVATFNLTGLIPQLLIDNQILPATIPATFVDTYTTTFYTSASGANAGGAVDLITTPNAYVSTAAIGTQQTIYVRAVNNRTKCVNPKGSFTIIVNPKPTVTAPPAFLTCDTDGKNDGLFDYPLDILKTNILGAAQSSGFTVTFYDNYNDALTSQNAIANELNYRAYTHDLWIRVENNITKCFELDKVKLVVELIPEPIIYTANGDYTICVDYVTERVIKPVKLLIKNIIPDQGPTLNTYQWYEGYSPTTLTLVPGAVAATFDVNQAAIPKGATRYYAVEVKSSSASPLSCAVTSKTFEVVQSGPAVDQQGTTGYFVTNAFEENQIITVTTTGYGTYQYSLDGGVFQDSPVFENVSLYGEFGTNSHIITVRDTEGGINFSCVDYVLTDVQTIDYPHYFTPNGDGINDTWNISGLDRQQAAIYIFNRDGKLIKQLAPNGSGWDGTFNSEQLPSTDYWFTVDFTEKTIQKQFKAHFSLKR